MYKKYGKKILDIVIALFGLVISIPLDLFVILCTCVEIKENPIFVQKRVGKDGKIFNLYKFKSMIHKNGEEEITKVGNIIRKTSFDEVPQLINVLKGDMSIVGPRPHQEEFYKHLQKELAHIRLQALPGLTGLVQINGRKRLKMDKALEYDIKYVQSISFSQDIRIILSTFKALLDMDEEVINYVHSKEEEYDYMHHLKLKSEKGIKKVVYVEKLEEKEDAKNSINSEFVCGLADGVKKFTLLYKR